MSASPILQSNSKLKRVKVIKQRIETIISIIFSYRFFISLFPFFLLILKIDVTFFFVYHVSCDTSSIEKFAICIVNCFVCVLYMCSSVTLIMLLSMMHSILYDICLFYRFNSIVSFFFMKLWLFLVIYLFFQNYILLINNFFIAYYFLSFY